MKQSIPLLLKIVVTGLITCSLSTTQAFGLSNLKYKVHSGMTDIKTEWGPLISAEKTGSSERWVFDSPEQTTLVKLKLIESLDGQYKKVYELKIDEIIEFKKRNNNPKSTGNKPVIENNRRKIENNMSKIRKSHTLSNPLNTYLESPSIEPSY